MMQVAFLATAGCVLFVLAVAARTLFRWVCVYYRHI